MIEKLNPGTSGPAEHRKHLCALTIMAKVPRAGGVKTRLCPPLTPQQAIELSECFLRDTSRSLAEASRDGRAAGVISYTPVGMEAALEPLLPEGFAILPQRGNTFGERLLATAQDAFAAGFGSVCVIDCDSPTVPVSAYRQAVEALTTGTAGRIVLGPTVDGGYYLIGMTQPDPRLFEAIDWSTDRVYTQTLERARAAGLEVLELPVWYDVDEATSLDILRTELLAGIPPGFALTPGATAPATTEILKQMNLQHSVLCGDRPEAGGAADRPVNGSQRPTPNPPAPEGPKR